MPVPTISAMKHLCGAEVFLYKSIAVSLGQQRLVKVTPVKSHTGTEVSVVPTNQPTYVDGLQFTSLSAKPENSCLHMWQ